MHSFDLAILSGGKGRQFQNDVGSGKDKALAIIHHQTILEMIINRFRESCEHFLVICGTAQRCQTYKSILKSFGEEFIKKIRFIPDSADFLHSPSPLRGILTAIGSANNETIATIPNDMPFLRPEYILPLVQHIERAEICTLIWPNRRLLPLISVYQSNKLLEYASIFGTLNRSRADDPIRAAQVICFLPLRAEEAIYSNPAFFNINTPNKLVKARRIQEPPFGHRMICNDKEKTIIHIHGESNAELVSSLVKVFETWKKFENKDLQTEIEALANEFHFHQMYFWEALSCEILGKITLNSSATTRNKTFLWIERAIEAYNQEHAFWLGHHQPFLALHSLIDQIKLMNPDSNEYLDVQKLIHDYKTELFENEPK